MALSEQDLMKIQEMMRNSEKDSTPFQIINGDGEMSVIGDANKTELKQYDYTVKFRVPAQFAELIGGGTPIIGGKYAVAEIEYKNVYISPRKDIVLLNCLNNLRPFLVEISPDGDSRDRGEDELKRIVMDVITNTTVLGAMYEFVGTVIGVEETLVPMMTYDSVFENMVKIIVDFPELINEHDFFTGGLSSNKEATE